MLWEYINQEWKNKIDKLTIFYRSSHTKRINYGHISSENDEQDHQTAVVVSVGTYSNTQKFFFCPDRSK